MAPLQLMSAAADEARLFYEISASCLTFTAALMGYVVDPHFPWANTARKASPIGEKYPRSTMLVVQTHLFRFGLRSDFAPKRWGVRPHSSTHLGRGRQRGSLVRRTPHCIEARSPESRF